MRASIALFTAVLFLFCSPLRAREYTFGLVPQQSAAKLARLWGPILQKLSEDTGLTLKLVTAKDIPTFESRLAEGKYDFAYMNPYHYTTFSESAGYIAIANQRNKSIQGIMVVHKDSPISSLEELSASTLAFPAPAAFAASILTQAEFNSRSIPFSPKYVSSHDSVYLAVARGLVPAGGGVLRTLNNTDPAIREQLKVLWKTPKYTPHAFAAHPDVADADRVSIQNALIALEATEEGMELLKGVNFKGIQAADTDDWDDVRSLNITLLDD